MRLRKPLLGATIVATGGVAAAQDPPPTTQPSRIDRLEQRVDQLENTVKSRDAEIKSRDAEIDRLNRELGNRGPAAQSQPASQPEVGLGDIDKTTQEMLKDIQTKESRRRPYCGFPANFNPNFAVIGDFAGSAALQPIIPIPRSTALIFAKSSWTCGRRSTRGRMRW